MEPTQLVISKRVGVRFCGITVGSVYLALISNLVSATPADMMAQVQSNYGKLPLSFAANLGQTDARVKFLSRGPGYSLFLTPSEAVLSLKKPLMMNASSVEKQPPAAEATPAILRMQFIKANPAPRLRGKDKLAGRVNHLIGKDPSRWRTEVPTYRKVAYESVYPGIDLVYYGNQGKLEYDFIVAPGADPNKIKLAFQGADKIETNRSGELILHVESGELRMHKPVFYQNINGVRKPVSGSYVLKEDKAVSFQVASYDTARTLVIDPVLVYSTFLGGSGDERGFGIAVDKNGQAYVTGHTDSSDFPTQNARQSTLNGDTDVFVAKFTADGSALRYSTYLGGSGNDGGASIAVNERGQAYVTGGTNSPDFPTMNALQPTLNGSFDAFVAQLTADGAELRYATYLGGGGDDRGADIAVDKRNQAYVTGATSSADFPTHNALQPTLEGISDAYIAKLSADGMALRYASYLGGSGDDGGSGITVDKKGQAYVTGFTNSDNFPTVNALQPSFSGGPDDAFVTKFAASGESLHYSTYLGGDKEDGGADIAVDDMGQAYVIGTTISSNFPTVNALKAAFDGHTDAFVAKLAANGTALRYATYLGGAGFEVGNGIAVDARGQAYVVGWTELSDFPTVNALQPDSGGQVDTFVAKFTTDGSAFRYATHLGGVVGDLGLSIAVDRKNQAYVTGETASSNFPTVNAMQATKTPGSPFSAFVAKIGNDNQPCRHGKKCKDDIRYREDHGESHKDHGIASQRELSSELNLQKEFSSELTLRDHLSNICQSGLKAFTCRLAHFGLN